MSVSTGFRPLGAKRPKRLIVNNASGELIAAIPGKRINVIAMAVTVSVAGTVVFSGDAGGGATERARLPVSAVAMPTVYPNNPDAWIECETGENLESGTAITGTIYYVEVGGD